MWPVSFVPIPNMSVWISVLNNVVPSEGFKIMIQIPVSMAYCKENGVNHRFEAQDDMLKFIAVFKYGWTNINICKNIRS